MGKINVYDKIVIENKNKRENMEIKYFFLHKSPSKGWFRNGIHSLLRGSHARRSADMMTSLPYVTHIGLSLLCGSDIVNDVTK